MAYAAPTLSQFLDRFAPVFDSAAPARVQNALDRSARAVDESWPEADYAEGRMLWAAHDLTLEGVGDSQEALLVTGGMLKSRNAGDSEEVYATPTGGGTSDAFGEYGGTLYGRKLYAMLQRLFSGPLAAADAVTCPNHLARDFPALFPWGR